MSSYSCGTDVVNGDYVLHPFIGHCMVREQDVGNNTIVVEILASGQTLKVPARSVLFVHRQRKAM